METPTRDLFLDRKTVFSVDRRYRYMLWREWDMTNSRYAMFIGLNPSTADETKDDPTIRKCIGFCKQWGLGSLCMVNLFAFRATDPKVMRRAEDPVGPENDEWIDRGAMDAERIIAAWGTNGIFMNRDKLVLETITQSMTPIPVRALRITKHGHPEHPLYVPYTVRPVLFEPPRIK